MAYRGGVEEAQQPLGDGGQARAEVAEARLLYALFDRLPAMIAYWDRDLRNVVANHAYIEWFGFTPEKVVATAKDQIAKCRKQTT